MSIMDLETMIDALNWMDIDDQIGYLQMLDYDYQELSFEDLQEIVEALDEIESLQQAEDIADIFGDRIQVVITHKITIEPIH